MKRTISASLSTMISLPACARYPSGGTPPIHIPFFFEAAILSRIRSPVTSRSNWAKDSSTLRVSRPIELVVLYVRRLVDLAFLSPELVEAILQGRQPVEFTATRLTELDLPLDWTDQRRLLAN